MCKNEPKLTNVKTAQVFLVYAEMSYPQKRQKRDLTFVYE